MNFKELQEKFNDLDFELSYEGNTYEIREYGQTGNAYEVKGRAEVETLLNDLERRNEGN